jgi:hypothetical protein
VRAERTHDAEQRARAETGRGDARAGRLVPPATLRSHAVRQRSLVGSSPGAATPGSGSGGSVS